MKPSKKRLSSPRSQPQQQSPTTETIAHTIYDTFTLLPEDEREYIYLFIVPFGQEKKTEVDTSMHAAGTYFQCMATDLCPEEMGTNAFKTTPAGVFTIASGQNFYARFKRQYLAPLDRYGKGIRARVALNGWLTRSLQ